MTCPGEAYCSAHPSEAVLQEVADERRRQDAKWGIQNHPDGTGTPAMKLDADLYRELCNARARSGRVTWVDILKEEVFEAFAESSPVKLRAELIQVAAVAVAHVEAIDRRG